MTQERIVVDYSRACLKSMKYTSHKINNAKAHLKSWEDRYDKDAKELSEIGAEEFYFKHLYDSTWSIDRDLQQ